MLAAAPSRIAFRRPQLRPAASKGFGKPGAAGEQAACPCCSPARLPFSKCCQPFHDGTAVPATPTELLRARFCAYARGDGAFVVRTTHPDNEVLRTSPSLAADVRASAAKLAFSNLRVLDAPPEDTLDAALRFSYSVRMTGQKGFSRPGVEEVVTELSTFRRAAAGEPWLFLASETTVEPAQKPLT